MRKIRIISLILVLIMVVGCFAACTPENDGGKKAENKVTLGSTTDLSGDFRFPGWGGSSAGASDQDINKLTVGYSTMETNQAGVYVWNQTVVKSHTEVEDNDGNLVVTIEINPGLKFSDGTEIKAANYLAYILAFSSPVVQATNHPGMSGQTFVGFESFHAYTGTAAEGATREFSGVRLLGDYKFSLAVDAAAGFYPYYFANTYGAITPYPVALILGEGASVKDDGNGAYIDGNWYETTEGSDGKATYNKVAHLNEARYDVTKYPFSGAYVIKKWDEGTKEVTLEINPNFAGNFEGQKPAIKTIVYTKIVQETQLDQFKTGKVDVLAGITGGDDTKAALAAIEAGNGAFAETHYQRAGYGKIQFECDFGPTMFQSVRQAITYALNTSEFASAFTGGYGTVIYGPYSPDFDMWAAVKDDITLIDYSYSIENAKAALVAGGWVYNSKGEAFVEGQSGVDSVRYKKLTAEEAAACDGVNKTYKSVENTDGIEFKTVKVGEDYYMPLVINWFGTMPNDVTEMLNARLVGSDNMKAIGAVVRASTGDFDKLLGEIYREPTYGYGGTPTYGMFNLATGWNNSVYDYAYNWSLDPMYFGYSSNKLFDEYDVAFPYDMTAEKLTLAEAMEQSGGKLGMDYLSMAMVYNSETVEEYNEWWMAYIERWNQLMPDIPLYSNYYYDVYNAKIENFKTGPFWGPADAILYCTVKNAA